MHSMREPSEELVAHLVDIDAHATMALVALTGTAPAELIIGVARYAADVGADANARACEFGVAIADAWQCRGLGTTLTRLLFEYAAQQGFRSIYGNVLASNQRMIELAEWLGLVVESPVPGLSTLRASRRLD